MNLWSRYLQVNDLKAIYLILVEGQNRSGDNWEVSSKWHDRAGKLVLAIFPQQSQEQEIPK